MADGPATLPDLDQLDPAALKILVVGQHGEIAHLRLVVQKLQRMLFGRSSEKSNTSSDQLSLLTEVLQPGQTAAVPQPKSQAKDSCAPRRKRKPRSLPAHLRREVRIHVPEHTSCPECGGHLKKLGEDVSEVLDYLPASFVVIRHVRPKMSCRTCSHVVQAAAPSRPVDRGLAEAGLLAHVVTSKFADHQPLYRQSQIYARQGVDLERSTLARWVAEGSDLVEPLVEVLRRYVMRTDKLHGDDTPLPVLAPGTGRTKIGRFWTYVRDSRPAGDPAPPAVWFTYSPDRKGEHPQRHLASFRGILQADAYAGFSRLYQDGSIQEAPCLAHIRRKFYDLVQAHQSPIAAEAVQRIAALYQIEKEIRGRSPDQRREVRNARARPLLESMRQWLEESLVRLARKSDTAAAIHYALARWDALARYLDDGRIELDNSAAERALRAVAVGRRNYLFAGSDSGGERAAVFYSLIGSAKLNGLDPEAYLRHVFSRIADHPITRIEELLPWNVAAHLQPAKAA
ncbi:MAG: IS66 family transposase [Acidobacteriaceae bacterium]